MSSTNDRVLFLTPYFRPYLGGIERAIEGLASEYLKSGKAEAVGVLTGKYAFPRLPHPEWLDKETTPEGISIFRLSSFPQRSVPLYSVPLVWFPPSQIRRYIAEFEPTVVHFVGDGWFWGHIWSWIWARNTAKLVFTPSFHTLSLDRQWLRCFNIPLCQIVDNVVALTELERIRVKKAYHVPESKLSVIGWGVRPPNLSPTGEQPSRTAEDVVQILCVGRLGEHKGQLWTLEAYRRARPRFHQRTRLVLVGRDEGHTKLIQDSVVSLGLTDEVVITGETTDEELEFWYLGSDLFVLFSKYEAFGLVYFEAMAAGVPVLTHDVGANKELLTKGSVVVPAFDTDAAADELVRLVNDNVLRKRLGVEGRDYALTNFTWPVVADKYLELYASV